MKGQFGPRIEENGVYNALAARNNHIINLLFAGHKQFDLRQTIGKNNKENKKNNENKENLTKKTTKMMCSLGSTR